MSERPEGNRQCECEPTTADVQSRKERVAQSLNRSEVFYSHIVSPDEMQVGRISRRGLIFADTTYDAVLERVKYRRREECDRV
jgi:hypothetical protein